MTHGIQPKISVSNQETFAIKRALQAAFFQISDIVSVTNCKVGNIGYRMSAGLKYRISVNREQFKISDIG